MAISDGAVWEWGCEYVVLSFFLFFFLFFYFFIFFFNLGDGTFMV